MQKRNGFTLVEVIVTLAIAAIVLSIGVPSFQSYIQNSRQTTAVNELATALQLARNSAITQRTRVVLCKSNNTSVAAPTCRTGAGSGDWLQGWMIFTDPNNSGTLDGGETILRVHGAIDSNTNVSFAGNNNVTNRVSFNAQGIALGSNGTILYCDPRGNVFAKALVISVGGQIRQALDETGNDGIVDIQGTNISCV